MDPPFEPGIARGVAAPEALIVLTGAPVEIERGRIDPGGKYRTCTLLRRTLLSLEVVPDPMMLCRRVQAVGARSAGRCSIEID